MKDRKEVMSCDNLLLKEVIDCMESNPLGIRYDLSAPFKNAISKAGESIDNEILKRMQMEGIIFSFSVTTDRNKPRFLPRIIYENGFEFPNIKDYIDEDSLNYYESRAKESKNPRMKSIYADMVWEQRRNPEFANIAIDAYLDCADLFLFPEDTSSKSWDFFLVDVLPRALRIAEMMKDKGSEKKVLDKTYNVIGHLRIKNRFRFVIELIETLLAFNKLEDYIDIERGDIDVLKDVLEVAISYTRIENGGGFHLMRGYLETLVKIAKLEGDLEAQRTYNIRIAKTHTDQAEEMKQNSKLVACAYLEDAIESYESLGGFKEKIEELKLNLKKCYNEAFNEGEFKEISSKIEIPQKDIDSFLAPYRQLSGIDYLNQIYSDKTFEFNFAKAKKTADELSKEFPIQGLLPKSIIKNNIVVSSMIEDEEKTDYQAIEQFRMNYQLKGLFFTMVFDLFKQNTDNHVEIFKNFLSDNNLIEEWRIEIISKGIEAHYEEQYINSVHLLVFQIEGILRDFLSIMKIPTFKRDRYQDFKERTLGDILSIHREMNCIDGNLIKFIEVFLTDIRSDNLRNEVGHGLAGLEAFTKINSSLLILILVNLACYHVEEDSSGIS